MQQVKYVHTNLIAQDWQSLANFYQRVFGCTPVPPERDLHGEAMEAGTGITGVRLRGIHLRLPGYDANGPTLEIFNYQPLNDREKFALNRPGYGHIAFRVSDVPQAQAEVILNGGKKVGEIVTLPITPTDSVTWCYVMDPEGNMIELQSWITQ